MKEAVDLLPSRPKTKKKPKLAVWNLETKQAIYEKKKAFWDWKMDNRPQDKDNSFVISKNLTTQNLRRLCRMESARQRETRRQEILDAKYEDSGMFHRLIKKQRGRLKQFVNELQVNGNKYPSEADILQGFREHFQALATSNVVPRFEKKYGELVQDEIREIIDLCGSDQNSQPDSLTQQQVKKAIASLNKG